MAIRKIKDTIFSVGANDYDRKLFDELIPLPDGTSYNAYLINGSEKTALIDTVHPSKKDMLLENLDKVEKIDFIISNHSEQDHSGAIPDLIKKYPQAKVVTNSKGKEFLKALISISEDKFVTINDGDIISLGNKTLKFIFTPWVHWPETIATYLIEDKILFSCDLFGSHLASEELFAIDEAKVYIAAKRYYAEIMMPFRAQIINHLNKIGSLEINLIAPSHGPVYSNANFILNAYKDWTSEKTKNEVIIAYVSMYSSTRKMVDYLAENLTKKGIDVQSFNLTNADLGEIAISLVDANTLIIATPAMLVGPHPSAVNLANLVNILRPKLKYISVIGSYLWGNKIPDTIKGMLTNLKAEFIEPVVIKGYPKEEDFQALQKLANNIAGKLGDNSL